MRWLLGYFADAESGDLERLVRQALEAIDAEDGAIAPERQTVLDDVHARLSAAIGNSQQPRRRSIIRRIWPYAAAVVVMLSFGIYWLGTGDENRLSSQYGGDLPPGTNRATLAFADGRSVDLSETQQGIVVAADGDEIRYLDGSEVPQYGADDNQAADLKLYTPKGGVYSVTLSDGTKVWLNAASSLTYPAHFSDKERVVTLEGEAFFDVEQRVRNTGNKQEKVPFKVVTNGQTVEVLGTTFGIAAYPDEPIKTTLVEGAVRLHPNAGGATVSLTPGEQGVLAAGGIAKYNVNVSTHTAWKDGLIVLKDASVSTVIKQIERWYDVTFVGASELTVSGGLSGELPRDIRLSELLQALALQVDATFKIEGRRVFVNR